MNRSRLVSSLVLCGLTMLPWGIAWSREQVIWASTLDEAWQLAQEHERPMLVFVTRPGCKYCTRMKAITYADEQVAREVNNRFVPVIVTPSTAVELIKKLDIRHFPTTLVITTDYYVVEQVKGYVPPAELHRRLNVLATRIAAATDAESLGQLK
jgi:hypothetical protein